MILMHLYVYIVSVIITVTTGKSLMSSPPSEGRIVGGVNVSIEEVPYQISLLVSGVPYCGGTIISKNVILTAAHCTRSHNPRSFSVLAGSELSYMHGIVHRVSEVHIHEKYNPSTLDFDVSLLVLEKPLQLSTKIQPLPLPDEDEFLDENETVIVSGWGDTMEGGQPSTVLQAIKIPVVNQTVCQKLYSNFMEVTPRMLCAGYIKGGMDHCNGDSGGPVVSNGKAHGIVSWANGCARQDYPGVNTRVTAVREWIRSRVQL